MLSVRNRQILEKLQFCVLQFMNRKKEKFETKKIEYFLGAGKEQVC